MSRIPLVLVKIRFPPVFTPTAIIADRIHQRRCWVWFNFEVIWFDDNSRGHALQRRFFLKPDRLNCTQQVLFLFDQQSDWLMAQIHPSEKIETNLF